MRKRTIKKQIWINQNEDNLLKYKSKKSGLNESEFLRSCIKGYKVKEQPTKEIKVMRFLQKKQIKLEMNLQKSYGEINIRL